MPGQTESRTISTPIVDERFQTDDMAAAESAMRRVYRTAELREGRQPFGFRLGIRGGPGVDFSRFRFTSWVDAAADVDVVAVGQLLHGRQVVESGGRRLDTSRPFLLGRGPARSVAEDLDLLMVDIRPDVLERVAGERLGVDRAPVRFLASAPVSRAMEAHWRGIVGYAWTNVVQVDEVFRNDLIRVATFEAVVAAALAAFPMTVAEPWRLRADAVRSPAIRRALCYIEEHPDRALTVGEIAAAAGCSVRALQQGFRRQLDTTPLEHVRRVRLHEVRAELLDADAAERGVTEIARRWGFGNLGRFAAAYRAEFGENPTATLHR